MKSHYEVLDGLRGVAAFSVFAFHILELVSPRKEDNWLFYAYLAVDFFFVLSGFVLGYAYDNRLSPAADPRCRIGVTGFFTRRLIRLHPMVIIGMTLGFIGYIFDPFAPAEQRNVMHWLLILNFGLGLLMLPAPGLPACWGSTHSLDAPAWSLTQEYLANVLYGFFGHRLKKLWLALVFAASAAGLVWYSLHYKWFGSGWGWQSHNFWAGPLRMCVSFSAGVLIYRLNLKFKVRWSFLVSTAVLMCVFMAPVSKFETWKGLFDVSCVLIVFPLIVMAGAGEKAVEGFMGKLCRLSGRLSYPVYIIHYPFVMIFAHWNWTRHPVRPLMWLVAGSLYLGVIVLAWLFLAFYDEPVRNRLTRRFQPKNPPARRLDSTPPESVLS